MWFPAVTTSAPASALLDLDDVKGFLRVSGDDEDVTVEDAMADAVAHVEAYTGTRMLTQTVRARAGSFQDLDHLPIGPAQSVSEITYLDTSGVEQTLDSSMYEIFGDGLDRGIRPAFGAQWPATRAVGDAVKVTLVVGYGDTNDVPPPVMRAIRLLIGDYYTIRGDTVVERSVTPATLPNGVDTLLANFRVFG